VRATAARPEALEPKAKNKGAGTCKELPQVDAIACSPKPLQQSNITVGQPKHDHMYVPLPQKSLQRPSAGKCEHEGNIVLSPPEPLREDMLPILKSAHPGGLKSPPLGSEGESPTEAIAKLKGPFEASGRSDVAGHVAHYKPALPYQISS
jgi:hypothetical protein